MRRLLTYAASMAFSLLLGVGNAHAQSAVSALQHRLDSLRAASFAQSDSTLDANPYYYRLIGTPTYFSSSIDNAFSLDSADENLTGDEALNEAIDDQLFQAYRSRPWAFHHYDEQYRHEIVPTKASKDIRKDIRQILDAHKPEPPVLSMDGDVASIGLEIQRPNFWKTSGEFSLQFSQNYFSENWYRGGNNNQTLLANLTLNANYNDQRRITWDNRLIMRLGFITTSADTCHTFITNNDKLNLYSKLGVKATKSWYYTVSLELNTQFMPGYRTNDRRTYSDFLSPLDFFLSIGMDYKPQLKNGNTFSLALLPLSYKFRYIKNRDENIHRSYSMVGIDFQQDFGSKLELNAKIKIAKDLYWRTRAYYFTSYEYAEAEWENVLSYAFSKYISTELYTLWRFDDNRSRDYFDRNLGYFQFKEYFTFGIKYDF